MQILDFILLQAGKMVAQESLQECDHTMYFAAIGGMAAAIAAQWLWMKALSNKASEAEEKRAKFAENMVTMLERRAAGGQ
jgi:hypothetical protein